MVIDTNFQTPPEVCRYMASLIPIGCITILEPTPGTGNLVHALKGYQVTAPEDYFLMDKNQRFDCVVMNPPFSSKTANTENIVGNFSAKGMRFGYAMLLDCMKYSDNVIALMPWFTISDSDVRLRWLKKHGLVSVTALPRKTFEYTRIQVCILQLSKGFAGRTEFKVFDFLPKIKSDEELLQAEFNFETI